MDRGIGHRRIQHRLLGHAARDCLTHAQFLRMPFVSRNPYTEELIREFPSQDWDSIEARLAVARLAFLRWRETTFAERARALKSIAEALREDIEDYARVITQEMGKPIKQARAEIEKCARGLDYFAENAESMLSPIEVEMGAHKSYVAFQPLGVLLAIMPWNFPFWQVVRFAAPAIAAGNVVLLKPAPNTPRCALALREAFDTAGFDFPLLDVLFAEVEVIPDIIRHPAIAGVTFTGSTRAGREVAKVAGEALKKCVLELGGSDPAIILPDANLDVAIPQCVQGRYQNSGQSCIAIKRFIVDTLVMEEFLERFIEQSRLLRMGDPMDEEVDIGPIARADLRENLHRQVQESIEMGAVVHLGGKLPEGRGYFYPPTVLSNISPDMPVWKEETFGPVAPIYPVNSRYEAVQVANASSYGLGAEVFTENLRLGEELARMRLEAGNCFVNHFVFSDPRLPFGGIKQSGFGRELGIFGIREFVNIKTVYVA
ncbi:MAG: NAD-dependent succinate-semialdehyde dehydrogenase [Fimbriimonadales bacterium]|nr:NAD-dependent succinate-semialdehyde dehydrogenase [Fimbriimonadales bacterium]